MSWLTSLFSPKERPLVSAAPIFFTNTLTGKKEVFSPQKAGSVHMYSCGPTVYSKQHVGNLRAAVFSDLVSRLLSSYGYRVHKVVNITDVGHLVSDADEGEDKIEMGAKREGISAAEIAERYTRMYLEDIAALGVDLSAIRFPRATEFMKEQIDMATELEARGHTYRTTDGIYFDVTTFPGYGKLGGVDKTLTREYAVADLGRRISENKEKRHPADFALWKFSPPDADRQQEWDSPWGIGFPGWHLECSAMAKSLLGTTLDIHTGGIDHIPVHHNNEIAQSESVSGKPLARYWLHNAFLTLEGEKVSKSLGHDVYLSDILERGYHPLAFRYLLLQAHYRSPQNFTWEALGAANEALHRLWKLAEETRQAAKGRTAPSDESRRIVALLRDDLSTPQALALLWDALKDEDLEPEEAWGVVVAAEPILGLSLTNPPHEAPVAIPKDIEALARERDAARANHDFSRSDELRVHIESRGYRVEDTPQGSVVTKRPG